MKSTVAQKLVGFYLCIQFPMVARWRWQTGSRNNFKASTHMQMLTLSDSKCMHKHRSAQLCTVLTSYNPPPALPALLLHTQSIQPRLVWSSEAFMWAVQTWVWAGEWAVGSERQPWFTGQACSFTREISRATINTTVSFKGAVYHTTGFEGPQTDLVFVVSFL